MFITLILVFYFSCESKLNDKKNKKLDPMEGVWELTEFHHLKNGDTLITDKNKVQHKIYLNGYVMWNTNPASDSSEWHGYGTYTYKKDTVIEILTSMSKSMKSDVNKYIIPVKHGYKTYKQINTYKNNDTIYQNIEVYKKLD
ncbi:hypothetical protein PG913_06115 [Tenacibaculum pacificus]|uniref:hypothetical protein n=1 Tax=Tenacibaculum pacificus TaxID=3018314 RepID=UPI0022F3BF4D|nr:hypothetical protein [Tenacibaculum pacificus]WBX74737.1 hypothetical protein PG913_06115 [Tenacibaculum pacificus]